MKVIGDYHGEGYAHLEGLIAPDVAAAFMAGLKQDMGSGAIPLSRVENRINLLRRAAFEVYGFHYKPMLFFLWGLTPIVSELVGRPLLPTYDYFRIYREGDICRVHSDRYSCEHSLSLTLAYSDDRPWPLELGKARHARGLVGFVVAPQHRDTPLVQLLDQRGTRVADDGVLVYELRP